MILCFEWRASDQTKRISTIISLNLDSPRPCDTLFNLDTGWILGLCIFQTSANVFALGQSSLLFLFKLLHIFSVCFAICLALWYGQRISTCLFFRWFSWCDSLRICCCWPERADIDSLWHSENKDCTGLEFMSIGWSAESFLWPTISAALLVQHSKEVIVIVDIIYLIKIIVLALICDWKSLRQAGL